jgi:ribosomal protein S18 acetylase RimI-like enzyme
VTATASTYRIALLADVPARVRGIRQELNHLFYGPSEVLVARAVGAPEDQVAGAVRLAMRERPAKPHGLIADLVVDEELRESGLPEQLIAAAEERLKQRGAEKLDAVTVDGQGWAPYYFRRGFWSSRRLVVLTWDLAGRNAVERSPDFRIERVDHPDPETTAPFIVNSYQPYFRWWKEAREDQKWDRVELQEDEAVDKYQQAAKEIQQRAVELVASSGGDCPQTYFLAYQGDTLVGLCDAKDSPEGQDTFDWCVLVSRSFTGKALGSTLLDHALEWLAARGRKTAEYTATSGLDDYDPIIYLSTVVTGAQIRGEFLNLVKNRLT